MQTEPAAPPKRSHYIECSAGEDVGQRVIFSLFLLLLIFFQFFILSLLVLLPFHAIILTISSDINLDIKKFP